MAQQLTCVHQKPTAHQLVAPALQEHVAGLESQVAELQAQLQALEMEKAHDQAQLAALAEFGGTCCLASPTKPLASQQQQQQQQQQPDHIRTGKEPDSEPDPELVARVRALRLANLVSTRQQTASHLASLLASLVWRLQMIALLWLTQCSR